MELRQLPRLTKVLLVVFYVSALIGVLTVVSFALTTAGITVQELTADFLSLPLETWMSIHGAVTITAMVACSTSFFILLWKTDDHIR